MSRRTVLVPAVFTGSPGTLLLGSWVTLAGAPAWLAFTVAFVACTLGACEVLRRI